MGHHEITEESVGFSLRSDFAKLAFQSDFETPKHEITAIYLIKLI